MKEILYDIGGRILNGLIAFGGVLYLATAPIDWSDPKFWGGVIMVVVPAVRNSKEYVFNRNKLNG